jgi:hypothetical protein
VHFNGQNIGTFDQESRIDVLLKIGILIRSHDGARRKSVSRDHAIVRHVHPKRFSAVQVHHRAIVAKHLEKQVGESRDIGKRELMPEVAPHQTADTRFDSRRFVQLSPSELAGTEAPFTVGVFQCSPVADRRRTAVIQPPAGILCDEINYLCQLRVADRTGNWGLLRKAANCCSAKSDQYQPLPCSHPFHAATTRSHVSPN